MGTHSRLEQITRALDALVAAGADRDPAALSPGQLVAVGEAAGRMRRAVDALCAQLASEVARQSRPELGRDSLAKKQGHKTPEQMISATTGVPVSEARRMVQVGDATAPRISLLGEVLPEKHPHVAEAVNAGVMGVAAASAIVGMLDKVSARADQTLLAEMEEQLVAAAPGRRPDELSRLLVRAEALLDPDGLEPKLDELRAARALTISERDGQLVIEFRSDVASGAPVRAAIEGIVTATLNSNRNNMGAGASGHKCGTDAADSTVGCGYDPHETDDRTTMAGSDDRSLRQLRADALIELCEHALGCEATPTRPTATVVVRVTLEELQTGVGQATIDGTDHPIPASEIRRMAATLQIIPLVLGGKSEILDMGRTMRLFTPAQKHAITERDGGCVSCGAPPSRCHVHHIRWWSKGGRTDLGNGVLLCSTCHHRIHDDGWDIHIDGTGTRARVWLIPPPWLDPRRTPRPAGRHRYDLAA